MRCAKHGMSAAYRTAAAWRVANRSPLLRTLVGLLPAAAEPPGMEPADLGAPDAGPTVPS